MQLAESALNAEVHASSDIVNGAAGCSGDGQHACSFRWATSSFKTPPSKWNRLGLNQKAQQTLGICRHVQVNAAGEVELHTQAWRSLHPNTLPLRETGDRTPP